MPGVGNGFLAHEQREAKTISYVFRGLAKIAWPQLRGWKELNLYKIGFLPERVQGVLTLCEFHYCDFSKKLPYKNFWLYYFITATFWAKMFALCEFLAISFH